MVHAAPAGLPLQQVMVRLSRGPVEPTPLTLLVLERVQMLSLLLLMMLVLLGLLILLEVLSLRVPSCSLP